IIFIIVNYFTKYIFYILYIKSISVENFIIIFIKYIYIYIYIRVLSNIISNKDNIFINIF
ncbi:hypothetical protein ASPVEDRAFT_145309, partial [Aspergillus versicolor CBS 583.65]